MKEHYKPTRHEWEQTAPSRPAIRRTTTQESEEERLDRIAGEQLDARLEDEDMFCQTEKLLKEKS